MYAVRELVAQMVEPKVQKEDVGEVSGDDIVSETDASKPASKSQVPHDQQKQKTAFDFNEQTNYVPVSRIVIVSPGILPLSFDRAHRDSCSCHALRSVLLPSWTKQH